MSEEMKAPLREERSVGDPYRKAYLTGLECVLKARRDVADRSRCARAQHILNDKEEARRELSEMLGWPLVGEEKRTPRMTRTFIGKTDYGAEVYRVQFEVLEGLPYYGLLLLHPNTVAPLAICQHGGAGTPELCAGIYGSTTNYNDMTRRAYECGVHVFSPQNLNWDLRGHLVKGDEFAQETMNDLRRALDSALKQVDSSITAIELWSLSRALDALSLLDEVDASRGFGMIGLSYGGFYTMYATALDTRIVTALSSCFYNDRYQYSWSDWTWKGSAEQFLDAEIALLIYPRKMVYQVGDSDPTFRIEGAKREYERFLSLLGKDPEGCARFEVFEGSHELSHNDDTIKEVLSVIL